MIDTALPYYEQTRRVAPSEIDDLDHVNNVVYVQWANDIAVSHWKSQASAALQSRVKWFLLEHRIFYKKPALAGQEIVLRTQVGRATNVKYERFIEMYHKPSMTLLAQTRSDWCAVDATGRPTRITDEIKNLFHV